MVKRVSKLRLEQRLRLRRHQLLHLQQLNKSTEKTLKGYFEKYSILSRPKRHKNIKIHFQIVKMSDAQDLINTMKCALGRFELLFEHLKFF